MSKSNQSKKVLNKFFDILSNADRLKDSKGFVLKPSIDFSRQTQKDKLSFQNTLKIITSFSSGTLFDSLNNYFDSFSGSLPTASAFVQARSKISSDAFKFVFFELNKKFPTQDTYKDFHLLAVDGSDINIPFDPNDIDTIVKVKEGQKPYSQYHLNAAYDVLEKRYTDAVIQPARKKDEIDALKQLMLNRPSEEKNLWIADRGYPSWNIMALCNETDRYYLIRDMDIFSSTSRLRKFNLPNEEFDFDLNITLTTKQTNEIKLHPEKYRFISSTTKFDYLDDDGFYTLSFRAIRFKLKTGTYECIITNVGRDIFTADDIKEIYRLRWAIETGFRHLKYSACMTSFHSRKRELLMQEIWSSLIMYNISTITTSLIFKEKMIKKKHTYAPNLTIIIKLIRTALYKKSGGIPPDLDTKLLKQVLPVRPNRQYKRNMRNQTVVGFNYRFS